MVRGESCSRLPDLGPNLQVSFYYRLQAIRGLYLHEALRKTVAGMSIKTLDSQLARQVKGDCLRKAATFGLRGEVFFAVPCVIEANPYLLGYYRLLLGLSQKEIYNKRGMGRFKCLEDQGTIPKAVKKEVPALCGCLVKAAEKLVDGIDEWSLPVVHDLQLLTIGPQFRGSENTRLGQGATVEFRDLLRSVVAPYIKDLTERTILLENDSGRPVLIEFSSDPDVRISEKMESQIRPLVSIEIKGGTDVSNVHNRLGEAEKSHQKARDKGFFEFWTVLRVDIDYTLAARESPTTSHFFHLDRINDTQSQERRLFADLLASLMGIKVSPR